METAATFILGKADRPSNSLATSVHDSYLEVVITRCHNEGTALIDLTIQRQLFQHSTNRILLLRNPLDMHWSSS